MAASFDVFLCYSRADAAEVQRLKDVLKTRGIKTFLDRDDLRPGLPWPMALEEALRTSGAVAVFVGRELGAWQKREIAFALVRQEREEREGRSFPVVPVLLPESEITASFLFLQTAIDLRRDALEPEGLNALEQAIRGERSQATPESLDLCPYRGLKAFREEDAAFFCGREKFAGDLFAATLRGGFVPVIGPSGSGKSSVVFAGLMPFLRRECPPRDTWDVVSFTPGEDPFQRLGAAIIPMLERDLSETDQLVEAQKMGASLRAGELRLSSVIRRVLEKSNGTDRLLLAIDQFEELFTVAQRPERQALVKVLLEAQAHSATTVVASLRADFYGHAISTSRELSDRMAVGQVTLGMMTRDELRRAIEQPAQRVGLTFEDGLVDRLLDDVGDEPGNIPLLAFVLAEMWVRRKNRRLLHSAYAEIGAVQGAVAQRAEEEFGRLSEEHRDATRRMFTTRLVRVASLVEGGDDTRRQAELQDLDEASTAVVQRLTNARLLVTGTDPVRGKEIVQVAHEALIRNWTRLRAWINEDREFLLWKQRFEERAREWKSGGDEAFLLRGALLQEAGGWVERRPGEFTPVEREFVKESVALRKREENERRRLRRIIGIAAVAALLALVYFGTIARLQSKRAESEDKIAVARQLAALADQARAESDGYLDRSGLLAVESLRHAALFEGTQAIRPAAMFLAFPVLTLRPGEAVRSIAYSPDGKALLLGLDKSVLLCDAQTGRQTWKTALNGGIAAKVVFSNDGRYVAVASGDKTARVLAAASGRELGRITHSDGIQSLAISPNSAYLATASYDKTARILELATGKEIARLDHPDHVSVVVFSRDSRILVTGGSDYFGRVFETSGWHQVVKLDHKSFVEKAAFSPGGGLLATADFDKNVRVFDTRTWSKVAEYKARAGTINSIAFSPNGRYIAVGGRSNVIDLIEAQTGKLVIQLPTNADVEELVFAHNSGFLAWSGDDNTARVVDARLQEEEEWVVHTDAINQIAVSPDDRHLASAGTDGVAQISKIETSRYTAALIASTDFDSGAITAAQRAGLVSTKGLDVFELPSGAKLKHLDAGANNMEALAFSPDGSEAALGDWAGVRLFDAKTFEQKAEWKQDTFVKAVAFSADGRLVAVGSSGLLTKDIGKGTAVVYEVATGRELGRFSVEGGVTAVAFSADGKLLAAGCADLALSILSASNRSLARRWKESAPEHRVRVFEIGSKRKVAELQGQSSTSAVSFSGDGSYLAIGSVDGTARIVATKNWKEMFRLVHQGGIRALAFSHNSRYLASGSDDHSVRVVEAASGQEVARLSYEGSDLALEFAADDSELTSLARGRFNDVAFVRTDLLSAEKLIDSVCGRLTRNLTRGEWQQYLPSERYRKTCANLPEDGEAGRRP